MIYCDFSSLFHLIDHNKQRQFYAIKSEFIY